MNEKDREALILWHETKVRKYITSGKLYNLRKQLIKYCIMGKLVPRLL